jgi:pyruvate dehydrogenase E2 component (dihydrolipoamide acetyltransferase)
VTRADLSGRLVEPGSPEEPREPASTASRRVETRVGVSTSSVSTSSTSGDGDFPGAYTDTPLKGVRKVIAERMMNSLASSAQLTYTATAPAAGLLALRKRLKNASDPELAAVTIGDLVGYATVKTLAKHSVVNAHLSDGVLRGFANVHLGMAVDTPRGLLVPTLRFADTLTLREFSVQSKQLANEAIGGSINPDLLSGATFTVSNLGSFGIESFTPLLNVPQVAILGVDAIFPRAVINADGSVGAEQRIGLSLTADHRVIDGADAARYLKDLCAAIADIDLTVLG